MKRISSPALFPLWLLLCAVFATACSKKSGAHEHKHGHHEHVAPHGGLLVELGEHQFALELVHDQAAGTLTAYLLDGHAENFVRVTAPAFAMVATVNGAPQSLTFTAVANAATGERVGDTSAFTAQADWLKTAKQFEATIPALEIRGAKYTNVSFAFRGKSHDGHNH
jgi:hypothetical protein